MKRCPYIRITDRSKMKVSRQHTNNRVRMIVNIQNLAGSVFAAKAPLPPAIAQHHGAWGRRKVLTRTKVATCDGVNSEGLKEVVSHRGRRQQLRCLLSTQ